MPAEQRLRRLMHRRGIERRWHVPDPAGLQRRPGAAVQDAVAIAAAGRREAGVPALRRQRGAQHDDGMRLRVWKFSASRSRSRRQIAPARSICATWPSACTPASVRPAAMLADGLAAISCAAASSSTCWTESRSPGAASRRTARRRYSSRVQRVAAALDAPSERSPGGTGECRAGRPRPPWRGAPGALQPQRAAARPAAGDGQRARPAPSPGAPAPAGAARPPAPRSARRAMW